MGRSSSFLFDDPASDLVAAVETSLIYSSLMPEKRLPFERRFSDDVYALR